VSRRVASRRIVLQDGCAREDASVIAVSEESAGIQLSLNQAIASLRADIAGIEAAKETMLQSAHDDIEHVRVALVPACAAAV
jgi:hypothetical protein